VTHKIIVTVDDPERLAAFLVRLARLVARERLTVTLIAPDRTYRIAPLDPLPIAPTDAPADEPLGDAPTEDTAAEDCGL
jgi:hypothetical protein